MTTRSRRILMMALNAKNNSPQMKPIDCNATESSHIVHRPKYETTKGTSKNDQEKAIIEGSDKRFSRSDIQIEEISSSEKSNKYETRQVDAIRRNVFAECKIPNCGESAMKRPACDIVTSTVSADIDPRRSDTDDFLNSEEVSEETDDSDYVPDSRDILSSDTDSGNDDDAIESMDALCTKQNADISDIEFNQELRDLKQATSKFAKRSWNKTDHCFFCDCDVKKFSRHIQRHHGSEFDVQKILALPVGDKRRKTMFTQLRNKGNFLKSVQEESVVPVRKPTYQSTEQPTASTYLPCKYCAGFYKRKYLYRHVKVCPHNNEKTTRTNAQSEGQSLFSAYKSNDILRKDVFPNMRPDDISFTAKTDQLICAVATRYLKSHHDKHNRVIASRKMRQLALLLIEMKKHIKVKNLMEALDPVHFDVIVNCTKIISKYDFENETYGAPSLAAHMGTELKDCIDVAYNLALKKNQPENEMTSRLKALKELINNEWRYEISTIANKDLQQKKWNKPTLIPLAKDLTLLKTYLRNESGKCMKALNCNIHDEKAFKCLIEVTYVQVLLLNRRRVGELQRMTVHCYISNINNKSSTEFEKCITESEKVLMKSFKRVIIKGKRGRGVPVLFTEEMVKNVELLMQARKNFVHQRNVYLFPNIKTSSSINGSQTVYKHVRLAGVENAAALTSTKLRKHLATMSQVINLSEQDLEQLAEYMGHTSDIHRMHYRLPNDVYQMAKISKLLILNEVGQAAKFKGKSLDEINIDLDIIEEKSDDEDEVENELDKETTNPLKVTHQNKRRILQPWTAAQKKVALAYFENHLNKKIPPKKNECIQLQKLHPDLLSNKSWEKIKIFIVNTYKKN